MPRSLDEIRKDINNDLNAFMTRREYDRARQLLDKINNGTIDKNESLDQDPRVVIFDDLGALINEFGTQAVLNNDPLILWAQIVMLSRFFEEQNKKIFKNVSNLFKLYKRLPQDNSSQKGLFEFLEEKFEEYKRKHQKIVRRPLTILMICLIVLLVGVVGLYTYEYFKKPYYYDNSSSIRVSLDKDSINTIDKFSAKLSIEEIKETSVEYEVVKNALKEITDDFMAVDIKLYNSSKDLKVNSPVSVTMPIPASYSIHNISVYHISDEGKIEKLDIEISSINNTITFKTSSFSIFAICAEPYTVTFIDYNEYDQKAFWGEKAYEPDAPIKVGYNFLGWYIGEEKYNFGKNITGNIILTPSFRQIVFIHLEPLGKEKVIESIRKLEELEFVLCAEPNYIFKFCEETITYFNLDLD